MWCRFSIFELMLFCRYLRARAGSRRRGSRLRGRGGDAQNLELAARRPEDPVDAHELLLVQRQLLERRHDALVVLAPLPDQVEGDAVRALLRRRLLVVALVVILRVHAPPTADRAALRAGRCAGRRS